MNLCLYVYLNLSKLALFGSIVTRLQESPDTGIIFVNNPTAHDYYSNCVAMSTWLQGRPRSFQSAFVLRG